MSKSKFLLSLSALVPFCAPAQTGPVQINQSSVLATGVNRATNGFPFTISQPGSYVLTSNLTVPANTSGVVITANDVTLDLGGFSVVSNCDTNCSQGGSGISTDKTFGISIRNGFVQGFYSGIIGGNLIEKISAHSNIGTGIFASNSSVIKDSLALNNGGDGIAGGSAVVVSDCIANFNGLDGIFVTSGTIKGNIALNNHFNGIVAGNPDSSAGGSTITGNTTSNNGTAGILLSETSGSTLTANASSNNQGNGFDTGASTGSTLTGNSASLNVGIGFRVNCPSTLIGNTALRNGTPEVEVGGTGCNKVNNLSF